VANNEDGKLWELRAASGNVVGADPVGMRPHGGTFEGTYIRVTKAGDVALTARVGGVQMRVVILLQ